MSAFIAICAIVIGFLLLRFVLKLTFALAIVGGGVVGMVYLAASPAEMQRWTQWLG